jgi:hypothetical protein
MTSDTRLSFSLLITAGLLAFVQPAQAVQFRLLGWAAQDLNLQFDDGKKPTAVYVSTESLSPAYHLSNTTSIVFYKRVEHEGKTIKQTACTVTIPPGMEKGVILLIPGDDTKAVHRNVLPDRDGFVSDGAPLIYNYVWIDDSLTARPSGTIEFRNFSRRQIAFQLDQHRHMLAPETKVQLPLVPGAKRMTFRGAAEINGQWKVFSKNPLPTRGPERMMVILRDDPHGAANGDKPNIKMISLFDWPAPAPETPAATVASR